MKIDNIVRTLGFVSLTILTAMLLGKLSMRQAYATAPNPSWWVDNTGAFSQYDDYQYKNGRTHQGTFYAGTSTVDSSSLGASYDGVTAVGPRYADVGQHVYVYFTSDAGASQEDEWQCTELVKRFLNLEYGVNSLSGTSGDQVVANYASTYSTIFKSVNNQDGSNSTNHVWPKPGDVLSYSDVHTAIVTNVNITDATNGNATLTLLEQNASSTGTTTQQFVGWKIKGDIDDPSDTGSDTVTAWLTTKNFVKTFGTSAGDESLYSLKKTSDGGSIALGTTGSTMWVAKLDAGGGVTWQKTYLSSHPKSIIQTSDGGYLVGGGYYSGHWKGLLIKLDSSGNVSWSKTYDYDAWDSIINTVALTSGGYIVGGSAHASTMAWLLKVDTSGSITWQKTYGNCGGYNAEVLSVLPVSDGYVFSGDTRCISGNTSDNAWIFKFDTTGSLVWQKIFSNAEFVYDLAQLNNGDIVGEGYSYSNNNMWLSRMSSSGSVQWERGYSYILTGANNGIIATNDGGYAVQGTLYQTSTNRDFWLGKFDSSDNLTWQKSYGGSTYDLPISVDKTNDGGYLMGGYTNSYGVGNYDAWIVKTDSSGNPSSSTNSCAIAGTPSVSGTSLTSTILTTNASLASSSVTPSSISVTPSTASWSSTAQCTN